MTETQADMGEGMVPPYRDGGGRLVAHRLQFPRYNMSDCDFPDESWVDCMCGKQHKVRIELLGGIRDD